MESYCPNCMAKVNQEAATQCPVCGAEMTQKNRPHQLPVMTILRGRYLIGRVLGEGGFGITYIGRDLVLGQRVAIKEFYPSGSAARHSTISLAVRSISQADDAIIEKGRSGFLKEAQAIARFRDVPSVVNVNDFFMENGTSYIVMEYLDGQSLQQWLKEKGPVRDFDTLYEMLRPVMDGLEKVHQAGIIHRDISPSNLMMNGSGEIKILDFGTARGFGQENEKSLSVVLKPGFAPVEQYRRHGKQGPWTDVYALCATFYKLLTGVTPESSVDRMMEDTLKPPSALGAKISPKQEKALMAGLAVDPDKRTRSVAQLVKELDAGSKKKKTKEIKNNKDAEAEAKAKAEAEAKAKAKAKAEAKAKAKEEAKAKAEEKARAKAKAGTDADNKETSKPETKKKKPTVWVLLAAAAAICVGILIFNPGIGKGNENLTLPTHTVTPSEVEVTAAPDTTPAPTAEPAPETTSAPEEAAKHRFTQVSASSTHIAALCEEGHVHTIGSNEYGQCETEDWSDVVKVVASPYATYGLRADGTVLATENGYNDYRKEWAFSVNEYSEDDWKDIVSIEARWLYPFGLKSDGTVVSIKNLERSSIEEPGADTWKNMAMIADGQGCLIGLTKSGTVVFSRLDDGMCLSAEQFAVKNWTDITAIDAGAAHSVGLKSDGTVVAVGDNDKGQCNVSFWNDIIAISAGWNHTVGLKSDGTVIAVGDNSNGACDVSEWHDVVSINAGNGVTVALTSDGRILTAGTFSDSSVDAHGLVCNHGAQTSADGDGQSGAQTAETQPVQRTVLHSGDIGDRITWELDSEGILTIDGSGQATNYNDTSRKAPWLAFGDSIEAVIISGEITNVPEYAFAGCANLKSVNLSQSITEIGIRAFSECGQLESIELPSGVTNISGGAFYNCKMLSDISLGDSVRKIRGYAFFGCVSLDHITLPGTLVEIEEYAFYGCKKLESIFFNGTSGKWRSVTIGNGNYPFGDVNVGTLSQ